MVDFVAGCIDEGAPEINVSGVVSIERISEGQVRIGYFRCRKGERVVVAYIVWGREQWLKMWNTWELNRDAIVHECFEIQALEDQRREMN